MRNNRKFPFIFYCILKCWKNSESDKNTGKILPMEKYRKNYSENEKKVRDYLSILKNGGKNT